MAIHADIQSIQRENHKNGHSVIDPIFHKKLRLPDPAQESRSFFDAIMAKKHPAEAVDIPDAGATEKRFVRMGGARGKNGRVLPSRTYMLKPYYKDLSDWGNTFGYPLAGWAEIAMQALMHAGGLGDMSQKAHAHLPGKRSPVLAIEIEPGVHRIDNASLRGNRFNPPGSNVDPADEDEFEKHGKMVIPDDVRGDAAKLAAMDFLINNQDRHGANLLFRPMFEKKATSIESLLAIDHGRSFHYHSSNRFNGSRDKDGLFNYMDTPGYEIFELRKPKHVPLVINAIAGWWKKNGKKIKLELQKQLRGITNTDLATHIETEFDRRARALDKMVATHKKSGALPYYPRNEGNKAHAELEVPIGEHEPDSEWEGQGGGGFF